MSSQRILTIGLCAWGAISLVVLTFPSAVAQAPIGGAEPGAAVGAAANKTATPGTEAAGTPAPVVIHRQRMHLRPTERYQVSLHLEPIRTVRLAAPFDGTVKSIPHKAGEKVDSGGEVVRMDTTDKKLLLDRAKALYRAAQLEGEQAGLGSGGAIAKQLAEAHIAAAKADLDRGVYWVEQGSVRAPFNVETFRVDVSEGQVVRMGDPLVTVGETTVLKVEIPVDRNKAPLGQTLQLKVEDTTAAGKVEAILPLAQQFDSLRELLPSAASAIVLFQNSDGKLKSGQTVYSPLIPRNPVTEVPNSSIGNIPDGNHKVQVLRDNVVRDVPIMALAPVGADRSFISGAFDPTDELITSASVELADGTVVRSALPAALQPGAAQAAGKGDATNRAKIPPANESPARRGGL